MKRILFEEESNSHFEKDEHNAENPPPKHEEERKHVAPVEDEEPTASLQKVLALLIQLENDAQHSIEAAKVDDPKTKKTPPLIAEAQCEELANKLNILALEFKLEPLKVRHLSIKLTLNEAVVT